MRNRLMTALMVALLALGAVACDDTGDAVDDGDVQDVEQGVEDGAQDLEQGAEDALDAGEDALGEPAATE